MDLRSRSYTSAAHHWAGPLGSPLPSCEARGVWCPKAKSCTCFNSNGKLHKLLAMIVLKPCNHWHLYMTLRYTMIYSKRVQLDHFRPILHRRQYCGGHWTAKSSCLAQVILGQVDQGHWCTMTQWISASIWFLEETNEGTNQLMSTKSDP